MAALIDFLVSPAAIAAATAAVLWPLATGHPTWGPLSRGRLASTGAISAAVGAFVFNLVQRLTAAPSA